MAHVDTISGPYAEPGADIAVSAHRYAHAMAKYRSARYCCAEPQDDNSTMTAQKWSVLATFSFAVTASAGLWATLIFAGTSLL